MLLLLGMVVVLAGCRDKELNMTLVQENWYQDYLINSIQADDVWNLTIVQDEQSSFVELEYSAFMQEYMRIENEDGAFHFYLSRHPHLPYNTVLNATIHTNCLSGLHLNKAATAVVDGAFQGSVDVKLEEGCSCKGGSFTGTSLTLALRSDAQMVDFNANATSCDVSVQGTSTFKGTLSASEELTVELLDEGRLTTYGGSAAKVKAEVSGSSSLNMLETAVDRMEINLGASEAFVNVNQFLGGRLADNSTLFYQPHPGLQVEMTCDTTSTLQPL